MTDRDTIAETEESDSPNELRRTLLKTLAAAGAVGGGAVATSGTAAADDHPRPDNGSNQNQLVYRDEWDGSFTNDSDYVDNIPDGFEDEDGATFDGKLTITDLEVNDDELVASGRLQGTLSSNPTERINQAFEVVLGALEEVLGLFSDNGNGGECPILELVIGPIFLDLLGLVVETNEIQIDITAVAGSGNLLGNLLCAVAGLLD